MNHGPSDIDKIDLQISIPNIFSKVFVNFNDVNLNTTTEDAYDDGGLLPNENGNSSHFDCNRIGSICKTIEFTLTTIPVHSDSDSKFVVVIELDNSLISK